MMHSNRSTGSVSCPVNSTKAAVSFVFINAVRFFSALRFYFYFYFYFLQKSHLKRVTA